jgi:hypothetical protein
MTRGNLALDELLDLIVLEEAEPSYVALVRWAERYPEHADAITEFFASWAVQAELPLITSVDQERLANLGVSHALNILHRRRTAPSPSQSRPRLISTARALGISEDQLAERVLLDTSVLLKLDLRRLARVPRTCLEQLADALSTVPDQIAEMTSGPPLASGARYKATHKPVPTMEDFADAIRTSSLPDEAKRYWLDIAEADRSSDEG